MSRATSHIDRRTLSRSGTTAAAALAASTAANVTAITITRAEGPPDPIFAAIERHRRAEVEFRDAMSALDEMKTTLPERLDNDADLENRTR